MLKADKLPDSWITVHRAMRGNFTRCLEVALDATEDDPIAQRVGPSRRCRRRYVGYVLARGFKNGRVTLAQPRGGVCVASRVGRSWSPLVLWNRVRLLASLSSSQRDRLQSIESAVEDNAEAGTWWVHCLAIRPRFRGRGLGPRLLRQALSAQSETPVLVQTARETLAKEMEDRGAEHLDSVRLKGGSSPLFLYRLNPADLRRSVEATSQA